MSPRMPARSTAARTPAQVRRLQLTVAEQRFQPRPLGCGEQAFKQGVEQCVPPLAHVRPYRLAQRLRVAEQIELVVDHLKHLAHRLADSVQRIHRIRQQPAHEGADGERQCAGVPGSFLSVHLENRGVAAVVMQRQAHLVQLAEPGGAHCPGDRREDPALDPFLDVQLGEHLEGKKEADIAGAQCHAAADVGGLRRAAGSGELRIAHVPGRLTAALVAPVDDVVMNQHCRMQQFQG